MLPANFSSGSSGLVRGAKKHEIYAGTFSGHLLYDLISRGGGGMAPLAYPCIATVVPFKIVSLSSQLNFVGHEHFFNTIQMITSQCECA